MELHPNFDSGTGFGEGEVNLSIPTTMTHIRSLPLTLIALIGATAALASGCDSPSHSPSTTTPMTDLSQTLATPPVGREFAVLAGGCFWCTEAIYAEMQGVEKVESGYTGGHIKNPGYREICTGRTGHAEAVRITFDPELVSFGELLEVFWRTHDPTTLNRQGADVGTQYRSAIFPQSEAQEQVARASLKAAEEAKLWDDAIVTTIEPAAVFYVAEDYHQDYFANNPDQGYCVAVVGPKVEKFRMLFADKLKSAN